MFPCSEKIKTYFGCGVLFIFLICLVKEIVINNNYVIQIVTNKETHAIKL